MPTLTAPRPTQATTRHTGRTVDTILASPAAVFTGLSGVGGAREAFASYAEEHNLTGHWRLHWNAFRASLESSEAARSEAPATEAPSLPLPAAPAAIAAVVLPPEPEPVTSHQPPVTSAPRPSRPLIAAIKEADQDFEFYPTTDEIIRSLIRSLNSVNAAAHTHHRSVLDIGAGNGKVLLALREQTKLRELHAIEKSSILCAELPPDVLIVGTDFAEQSLLSKEVDVIFCNPPYSQFEAWSERIIKQSACKVIYLVIPQRWEKSIPMKDAIRFREAECHKVGSFDFEDAEDRRARAKVDLLRITLKSGYGHEEDAFERFFNEQFADLKAKFDAAKAAESKTCQSCGSDEIKKGICKNCFTEQKRGKQRAFNSLVVGANYPEALVALYVEELANIERNYHLVGQLDVDLLEEFKISPESIMKLLKTRLSGLRNDYWHELFSHLGAITNRLTSQSRKNLLDTLHRHVHVDFTVTNILEVILWVIKNANLYLDSQLISVYELMVDKCNVHLYKSNQRTWQNDGWRYNAGESKNTHFALDYRIVTHRVGGVGKGAYDWSSDNGLSERGAEFLGDLCTIARNLGFDTRGDRTCLDYRGRRDDWKPGQTKEFFYYDQKKQRLELLFDVKGFKNGNLHLRLNQRFILALNVEHGRLKGWLRTPTEAAEELRDPEAAALFNTSFRLTAGNPALLLR